MFHIWWTCDENNNNTLKSRLRFLDKVLFENHQRLEGLWKCFHLFSHEIVDHRYQFLDESVIDLTTWFLPKFLLVVSSCFLTLTLIWAIITHVCKKASIPWEDMRDVLLSFFTFIFHTSISVWMINWVDFLTPCCVWYRSLISCIQGDVNLSQEKHRLYFITQICVSLPFVYQLWQ